MGFSGYLCCVADYENLKEHERRIIIIIIILVN